MTEEEVLIGSQLWRKRAEIKEQAAYEHAFPPRPVGTDFHGRAPSLPVEPTPVPEQERSETGGEWWRDGETDAYARWARNEAPAALNTFWIPLPLERAIAREAEERAMTAYANVAITDGLQWATVLRMFDGDTDAAGHFMQGASELSRARYAENHDRAEAAEERARRAEAWWGYEKSRGVDAEERATQAEGLREALETTLRELRTRFPLSTSTEAPSEEN